MTDISRRKFLAATGASAAAVGAMTLAPAVRAGAAQESTDGERSAARATTTRSTRSSDALVLHIPDATSGEIHYLVGTREIVVTDKALVTRLLKDVR